MEREKGSMGIGLQREGTEGIGSVLKGCWRGTGEKRRRLGRALEGVGREGSGLDSKQRLDS